MVIYLLVIVFVTLIAVLFFVTFGGKISYQLMIRLIWMVVIASISTSAMFIASKMGYL